MSVLPPWISGEQLPAPSVWAAVTNTSRVGGPGLMVWYCSAPARLLP